MARTYTSLLTSIFGVDTPVETYERVRSRAAALGPDDQSLDALRARGFTLSHRDWVKADRMRTGLAARWRELYRTFDVVLCPVTPTPAFPHDHSPEQRQRRIRIDGTEYPYLDQIVWAGIATLVGLPATAAPIGRSPEGLPIGVQIIGPYLEDRTPIAFAMAMEREFGGFVAPPGF
jgi:amidase